MAYLIGTDEAGYGPNLGPLVIAASVWRVPDAHWDACLYERWGEFVARDLRDKRRLTLADSKQLHRPSSSRTRAARQADSDPVGHPLQQGVHTALAALDASPVTWHDLWSRACPAAVAALQFIPWYASYAGGPLEPWTPARVEPWRDRWRATAGEAGIELLQARAVAVFAHELNQGVRASGSKGAVLSATTLDLVASCLDGLPAAPTRVVCDKHGGRNQYAALLQPRFPDRLLRVRVESRAVSTYDAGTPDCPLEFTFRAGGESFLPSALSSMLAKYLREEAMRAFNSWWCAQVPGLLPTAGYPVDARRFHAAIAARQRELGIADDLLWRSR
jgi:ribonuclease HII